MREAKLGDPKVQKVVGTASEHGIEIHPLLFDKDTRTAEQAAAAIGCEVAQIVKSLVFEVDGAPVLFLVGGADRLDPGKAAAAAGATEVRRADAAGVKDATGFSIGATPPFGHDRRLRTFIDRGLLDHATVWAAAGRPDGVFEISPDHLVRIAQAHVTALAE